MRLIGSVPSRRLAQEFSYYLSKEGIENTFEPVQSEGKEVYQIWILDEDDVESAAFELQAFLANPEDAKYHGHYRQAREIQEAKLKKQREHSLANTKLTQQSSRRVGGLITILLIITSAFLLFWGTLDVIPIKGSEQALIIAKEPYSSLLFDFPKPFELFDELAEEYPRSELEDPKLLPPQAYAKLRQAFSLPYWKGGYWELVSRLSPKEQYEPYSGPLFVKIGQGEFWRLFSPALLHLDIIHLLFNMIWLFVLGTQLEPRLGWFRLFDFDSSGRFGH